MISKFVTFAPRFNQIYCLTNPKTKIKMKKSNVFARHPAYRWHDADGLPKRPATNSNTRHTYTNSYANDKNRGLQDG